MSKVVERLKREFEEHKGEFVIVNHKVVRFVAIGDDGDDYYYATYDGRKITWNSAVGKLVYLKGKLDDQDYQEFIRLAKINHYDQDDFLMPDTEQDKAQQKHYAKKHRQQMEREEGENKYLTEVCWNLN